MVHGNLFAIKADFYFLKNFLWKCRKIVTPFSKRQTHLLNFGTWCWSWTFKISSILILVVPIGFDCWSFSSLWNDMTRDASLSVVFGPFRAKLVARTGKFFAYFWEIEQTSDRLLKVSYGGWRGHFKNIQNWFQYSKARNIFSLCVLTDSNTNFWGHSWADIWQKREKTSFNSPFFTPKQSWNYSFSFMLLRHFSTILILD